MEGNHEEKTQKIYKVIMLIILTAFITFMVTSAALYKHFKNGNERTENVDLDNYLSGIRSVIEANYLWNDEIDEQKLIDGAVEGYVSGLGDKYTEYIPKSEMQEFKEDITGSFVGIGVYMIADESTEKIVVYYPIPDSPAEKAGIKPGDIIVSVDGVEYSYEEFSTIASHIKGKEGTKVKLVIERDGKKMDFEIERAKIETNPIKIKMLDNNIGYLSLPSFDENCSKKFKEKADELVSKGAKSLIIDLRNNGGGIVDETTNIADYFLEKGKTIMSTKDNNGVTGITESDGKQIYNMPLVLLVNENTASASEILTAALKENGRAKVIGTTTYGKGVIQTVITLADGSGMLKITTAEYFTPNGIAINKKGIKPDVEVKLPDTVKSIYAVEKKDDTQLQKAMEELNK